MSSSFESAPPRERLIIFLVGMVQFVNILDFVMVMPLGPDFAKALAIDVSHLGYLGGSYTLAAAFAGLAFSPFLDRLDRRTGLTCSMLGLVVGTGLASFATGLHSLMAARIVAGLFGGPATSMALAIVSDVVPNHRRGQAMGAVMGAFSIASIVGVPMGLWAARMGDWRTPFWGLALFGAVLTIGCALVLPSLRGHLAHDPNAPPVVIRPLFERSEVKWSYFMTASVMMSGFLLIPNMSTYIQGNLGFARHSLEKLYAVGGVASYIAMRSAGVLIDRTRPLVSCVIGVAGFAVLAALFFIVPVLPVPVFFVLFMTFMALRNVAHQTIASKVPPPAERGRFMSVQSSIGHLSAALGAIISSQLLVTLPGGQLGGMPQLALMSITVGMLVPFCMAVVERKLALREQAGARVVA